jgi:hypothetical protein
VNSRWAGGTRAGARSSWRTSSPPGNWTLTRRSIYQRPATAAEWKTQEDGRKLWQATGGLLRTSLTILLPTGDRHYTFVGAVPAVGEPFHAAGEDWVVAAVREAPDGSPEAVLAPSDVFGHSQHTAQRTSD